MHEHEHAELADFVPERLDRRIVDPLAVEFRRDGDALVAELMPAARQFLERVGAAERVGVGGADEAAGIIALGLFRLVVDQREVSRSAHMPAALVSQAASMPARSIIRTCSSRS